MPNNVENFLSLDGFIKKKVFGTPPEDSNIKKSPTLINSKKKLLEKFYSDKIVHWTKKSINIKNSKKRQKNNYFKFSLIGGLLGVSGIFCFQNPEFFTSLEKTEEVVQSENLTTNIFFNGINCVRTKSQEYLLAVSLSPVDELVAHPIGYTTAVHDIYFGSETVVSYIEPNRKYPSNISFILRPQNTSKDKTVFRFESIPIYRISITSGSYDKKVPGYGKKIAENSFRKRCLLPEDVGR